MSMGIRYEQVGNRIESYFLIKTVTRGVASNGKPFLTLLLGDHTGEIEAKLWGCSPSDEQTFKSEVIVHIQGEITEYRGHPQLRIGTIRPTTPVDQVKIADFIKSAPISPEDMLAEITNYLDEIKNDDIQQITKYLLQKYENIFLEIPAASRNHHEYVSGLAHHVVCMLRLARSICHIYPSLNPDLLYAGVILHDLGKVRELSGLVNTEYTVEGKLLGHISIMANEIAKAANTLGIDSEEVLILQHIVLSHHSKGEWGSPKAPLIREAEILHFIDNIDAKMNMMDRALDRVQPGQFSERIRAMDHRSFYNPAFHEKSDK